MADDRFEVTAEQLATVRFLPSPGFETIRAIRYVLHPERAQRLHQPFLHRIATRTPGVALDVLSRVIPARGYAPDFLGQPTCDQPQAWLHAAATTAPDVIAAELHEAHRQAGSRVPEEWLAQPERARDLLVTVLSEVWETAMRAEWEVIEPVLRADIAARSRVWAEHGIAAVLGSLHPRVRWDGTAIIRHDSPWNVTSQCTHGLVLSPSVLVWPRLAIVDDPHRPAAIYYPALNTSTPSRPQGDAPLAALIGTARAEILAHLGTPARSTDIAHALNLSPATVSHHMTILRDAGLVFTSREGTEAWHALTQLGNDLQQRQGSR